MVGEYVPAYHSTNARDTLVLISFFLPSAMSFRESSPPASEQKTREDVLHDRLMKELDWTVKELESFISSTTELAHAENRPITKEQLENVHTWLEQVADGGALLPDHADEDYVTELADGLLRIYAGLTSLKQHPLTSESVQTPEELRVLDALVEKLDWLFEQNTDSGSIIIALKGIDTASAFKLREKILKKYGHSPLLAEGLAGLSSPVSMAFRRHLLATGAHLTDIVNSIAGVDTPDSFALRADLVNRGAEITQISNSLTGIDCPEAFALRERLFPSPDEDWLMSNSLRQISNARSMKIRRRLIQDPANADDVAESLIGVRTPQSMKMRAQLLALGVTIPLVQSLKGIESPLSMHIRREVFRRDSTSAASIILHSLRSVQTSESMALRTEILQDEKTTGTIITDLAISLQGIDTPEAWILRNKLVQMRRPTDAVLSLRHLDSEASMKMREFLLNESVQLHSVMQSLQGLASPQAMEFRERMRTRYKDDQHAPPSIAVSFVGVYTKESFEFRDAHFEHNAELYLSSFYGPMIKDYDRLLKVGITYAAAEGVK